MIKQDTKYICTLCGKGFKGCKNRISLCDSCLKYIESRIVHIAIPPDEAMEKIIKELELEDGDNI